MPKPLDYWKLLRSGLCNLTRQFTVTRDGHDVTRDGTWQNALFFSMWHVRDKISFIFCIRIRLKIKKLAQMSVNVAQKYMNKRNLLNFSRFEKFLPFSDKKVPFYVTDFVTKWENFASRDATRPSKNFEKVIVTSWPVTGRDTTVKSCHVHNPVVY